MSETEDTIKLSDSIYAVKTKFLFKTSLLKTHSFVIATEKKGIIIIDTGGPGSGKIILKAIEKLGYMASDVKAIALTHWHGDHSGSVKEITDASFNGTGRIKIFIGEKDLTFLLRKRPGMVKINPALKIHIPHSSGKMADEEKAEIIPLVTNKSNPLSEWGLEFIPTPGHTPGHTSYYHKETGSLFAGCALSMLGKKTAGIVPVYHDRNQQIVSAKKLSEMDFRYLYPAHIDINEQQITLTERIPFKGSIPLAMRLIGSIPFFRYPRACAPATGKEK